MMLNQIVTGNARSLAQYIPDSYVDFIICDPVYRNTDDYTWLTETAARVLKPNSACIAFCSDMRLDETKAAMTQHLPWVKCLYYVVQAKPSALRGFNVFTWTTPAVWVQKGRGNPIRRCPDTVVTTGGPKSKHKWNKNPAAYLRWIEAFTEPGDVVWDPFCGSGTVPWCCKSLGRNFIAFEIDAMEAERARRRVRGMTGRQAMFYDYCRQRCSHNGLSGLLS